MTNKIEDNVTVTVIAKSINITGENIRISAVAKWIINDVPLLNGVTNVNIHADASEAIEVEIEYMPRHASDEMLEMIDRYKKI